MKRYHVLYKGKIAFTTNVHSKAQSMAWKLVKAKGWDIKDVEIKDNLVK